MATGGIMYKSKTIGLNRGSKFGFGESITFNPNGNQIVGNVNMIGEESFYDFLLDKVPNNIETAIHDISSLYEDPIGTIRINTDGTNPQGQGAHFKITFDGTVTPEFHVDEDKNVKMNILGVSIEVPIGADGETVAEQFNIGANALSEIDRIYVSSSMDSGDSSSVIVQVISTNSYEIPNEIQVGFSMTAKIEISSPPKPGYGTWLLIGKEPKEFDEFSEEFYYFKRIA